MIKADALVLFMSLPDVEVVDSVTVSDEFDNKCWLIAFIELDSAVELVLLLLHLPRANDGEDEFCVDDDVLDDDELVELFELHMKEMPKKWIML